MEVWAPYHMSKLAAAGCGTGCKAAEQVQRMFLRKAFGGMPDSSTGDVMLFESGCVPMMHAWVMRVVGWYNRIIARPDDDIVKVALKAHLELAFDESPIIPDALPVNSACWSGAFYDMVRVINQDEAVFVRGLRHVDVGTILTGLTRKWQQKAMTLLNSVRAFQLRGVPDSWIKTTT